MSIAEKMAAPIRAKLPPLGVWDGVAQELAQAAWDVVKAEMLGDDSVVSAQIAGELIGAKAALTAAIKKLEE